MPITVNLPDGSKAEFPDGTPPEAMKAAIQKKFPPKGGTVNMNVQDRFAAMPKSAPGAVDYASQGLSGLNEGIAMGLGAPVDIATAVLNLGSMGVNKLAGTSIPQIEKPFGGSERIREGMLAPTIKEESADPRLQMTRRVAQEAGAWAVPGGTLASRAAKPIRTMAKEMPAVLGSGAGAAVAQQIAPDNPLAEFAGQMIGAAAPGGIARVGSKPKAPSIDALRAARDDNYEMVKKMGVKYAPTAYDDMLTSLVTEAKADNISPTRHQRAYSFIADMINRRDGQPMTLTQLDQLRQEVRRDLVTPSYGNPEAAADAHFGDMIIDAIDDMIAKNSAGSQTMELARSSHARLKKAEMLAEAVVKAQRRTDASGSGGNINNAIRQNLVSLLNNPRKAKSFTAEERAAIEAVIKQGKMENLLRLAGKLSPSGNGLSAMFGILSAANGLGAIPLAGLAAKWAADTGTTRKMTNLQRKIAAAPSTPRAPILPPSLAITQGIEHLPRDPVEITVRGGAR